jgi:hypothetical protein
VKGRVGLSGLTLIVALAMAAAHGAWSISRLVRIADAPMHLALALVPPVLWALGLYARSPVVLLVFVPVSWAAPAYLADEAAFTLASGLAAVWTLIVYAATSLAWLVADGPRTNAVVAWTSLAEPTPAAPRHVGRDGWLVAALIAGPALGFLSMPGVEAVLQRGFGPLAGLVGAGLCVLGTLLGLALATDVWRGRPPRTPSRRRAFRNLIAAVGAGLTALFAR